MTIGNLENLLLKAIRLGVILALFTPLVLGPFGLSFSEYPKALYFRIVVGVTVMLWMILLIIYPRHLPKLNFLTLSVLLFLAVSFVSSLSGFNFYRSFWGGLETGGGLINMLYYTAFFLLLVSVFGNTQSSASGIQGRFKTRAAMVPPSPRTFLIKRCGAKAESEGLKASERASVGRASDPETSLPNGADWLFLLRWVVAISFLSTLAGFLQKMGIAGFYGVSLEAGRISGTLSNPVYFGAYMGMAIFLALYLVSIEQKKDWKIIWAIVVALNFIAFLMSGVKGAFAGLMFGMGILVLLTFFFVVISHYPKFRRQILGLALAAVLVLGFLAAVFVPKLDFSGSGAGLNRLMGIFSPDALEGRFPGWETAVRAWKDKPLLGWGQESFGYLYDKYFDSHYYQHIHGYYVFFDAHNTILNLLAETGILGTVSYLLIFGVVFYILFSVLFSRDKWSQGELKSEAGMVPDEAPHLFNKKVRGEDGRVKDFTFSESRSLGGTSDPATSLSREKLSAIILISLFSSYFFQNVFAFDTVSTYVVFFFLLAFANNNYYPPLVRAKLLNPVKQWPVVVRVGAAFVLLATVRLMYYGNIQPALASYGFVRGVMVESKDYAGSMWHYRRAIERKTPYQRELIFMMVSRDVAALQGGNITKKEHQQLIAQNLIANVPFMMANLEKPELRYLNFYELLASSGEWIYMVTQDKTYLEIAKEVAQKALAFNNQWMQFYYLLGRLEVYQRNYDKAEEYFDRAFEVSRQDFVDVFNRYKIAGVAYGRIKDYERSAENFLKAVNAMYAYLKYAPAPAIAQSPEQKRRITKNDVTVFELAAQLHWQLSDKERAIEIYEKALEVYPEWEIQLKRDLEKMKSQNQ